MGRSGLLGFPLLVTGQSLLFIGERPSQQHRVPWQRLHCQAGHTRSREMLPTL
jgi:hypothetical protein